MGKHFVYGPSSIYQSWYYYDSGAEEDDSATGATAVVAAVNPRDSITNDLTLSVTTTATVNATTLPSGAKMPLVLLGEWNGQYSSLIGSYTWSQFCLLTMMLYLRS